MQPNAQQNEDLIRRRMRKYDAYVDVPETYRQSVHTSATMLRTMQEQPAVMHVAQVPALPEVSTHYVPPQKPQQTYQQLMPRYEVPFVQPPVQRVSASVAAFTRLIPAVPLETTPQSPQAVTVEASKKPVRKMKVFSSIVKASVEVERVTRKSVRAVKHSFEPPEIEALRTRRQRIFVRTFYSLGALSFVFSLIAGSQTLFKTKQPQTAPQAVLAATYPTNDARRDSEIPAENIPTTQDIRTYLVAPQYPRYIRIPRINLESRIRRLGLDRNGAVGTPNNINDTGWYDGSVKPGEKEGASVIVGHVAGPTAHGAFWDLGKLSTGDSIDIEKGNGEIVSYKVTRILKVPVDKFDMAQYLSPEVAGKHDLKLMTSAGKYDKISGQYLDRVIVFAQQ